MAEVKKVSNLTWQDLSEYLRLDDVTVEESNLLDTMLAAAKSYVKGYTGQDDLDRYEDFTIAIFVLVQDMWDNRSMYVDKAAPNRTVETILRMHSRNLL